MMVTSYTHLTEKIVRMGYKFSHLLNQILTSLIEVFLKIIVLMEACLSFRSLWGLLKYLVKG